ncbi:hypothetical protein [Cohnella herbarum]|uniref:Uncharacterized protein n=1 Tax=Cohnella herbarum TaxID=2728023 RepID=A0A7Z2VRU7_9BACL|nr:hypothetical protein [Cohnella herbarum]QJD88019.1 hypothetical protein HH215_06600 [Cohnella herbarum]
MNKKGITKLIFCCMFTLIFLMSNSVFADSQINKRQTDIPMLSELKQLSSNQLQVTYDQPVELSKGIDPKNYWIQSTTEASPTGIATLGVNDTVNPGNSLTSAKVTIRAVGNNNTVFVLTFNQDITKDKAYKMIICYVTKPGAPPYTGDNGSATFVGSF